MSTPVTSPNYGGPSYASPVLYGNPGSRFSTEWYKFIVLIAQKVLPSGPSSTTAADVEELAYLQQAITEFSEVPQLAKQVDGIAKLIMSAVTDALVTQALKRGDDALKLAFLLGPLFATGFSGSVGGFLGGGPTANRPANPPLYGYYFDVSLGFPIFVKSLGPVVWVNSAGYGPL